jgi:uridine phosphorylase
MSAGVPIGGSLKSRPVSQPEPAHPADPADPSAPSAPPSIHLRPTAELAERVLLPGDPGRALALAQTLIVEPRMFNHHRGLWGYTGSARLDGAPLTIQSTGMGGPSAAIVLHELIALGARRAVRVGTCGALHPDLLLGEVLIARESICLDGASRALAAGERRLADRPFGDPIRSPSVQHPISGSVADPVDLRSVADPGLTNALMRAAPTARAGAIVSVDLFYDHAHLPDAATDALAIEMEAATLFAVGARAGVPVGCVLAVSDTFDARGARTRIDDHALLAAAEAMGAMAATALGVGAI